MNKLCPTCGHYAVTTYIRGNFIVDKCYWCLHIKETEMFSETKKEKEDLKNGL